MPAFAEALARAGEAGALAAAPALAPVRARARAAVAAEPGPPISLDAELVRAARGGAAWASEALYRRHKAMVRRMVARLVRPDDREDLVQDAFLRAFENLDKIDDPQRFAGWLAAVVTHTAAVYFRRAQRERLEDRGLAFDELASRAAPADVLAELGQVARWLARIPAEARQVFLMRRVDRLTIQEVAASLGRSTATVKRRLIRAETTLVRQTGRSAKRAALRRRG